MEGMKTRKLTRKERREIIAQLCRLSRNGWRDAKTCDYEPLETMLQTGKRPMES